MSLERTLIIVKPELVRLGKELEALSYLTREGLHIAGMYRAMLPEPIVREHYKEVIGKLEAPKGEWVVQGLTQYPAIVCAFEGRDAVNRAMATAGLKTIPSQCNPGTVRHDLCSITESYALADAEKRSIKNGMHRSDNEKGSAERELNLWFVETKGGLLMPESILSYNNGTYKQ